MGFRSEGVGKTSATDNHSTKEARVNDGRAHAALEGALVEIRRLGGGVVESYPEDTTGPTARYGSARPTAAATGMVEAAPPAPAR